MILFVSSDWYRVTQWKYLGFRRFYEVKYPEERTRAHLSLDKSVFTYASSSKLK